MNDEGLADVEAASPFRLPRNHPGIGCRRGASTDAPAFGVAISSAGQMIFTIELSPHLPTQGRWSGCRGSSVGAPWYSVAGRCSAGAARGRPAEFALPRQPRRPGGAPYRG